ncbi:ATP-binding protein [Streptomyces sp. AP-93]|uniref:ATP-binding protein n=1 Tax=Streptomyces sp. AP-93 TaxID=2929048 RepID=UPI001FB042D6|nr:ATP-binding protein [Streptomyces sp. AP-93]MCJ0875569.1 ATP-binding protein [Streptomyces sp. AP-93]
MTAMRRSTSEALYRWTSCTPNPAAEARAVLRRTLGRLGLPGEAVSDGVLAASELVANATEHAEGPYELRLRVTAADIICEVLDHDRKVPDLSDFKATGSLGHSRAEPEGDLDAVFALLSERGRGLQIVHELTAGVWGYRVVDDRSKVAWLALSLTRG